MFQKTIAPKSKNKDIARREYILNILLVGALVLSSVSFLVNVINHLQGTATKSALSAGVPFAFILLFLFLFYLSKKGKIIISAVVLIVLFYLPALYCSYTWGALLPVAIILYTVVIVITGILISSRAGFVMTFITTIYLLIVTYLQIHQIIPLLPWQIQQTDLSDTSVIVFSLMITSVIAWIYNREMEQALERARRSEEALRRQRDNLEITVTERTKALHVAQLEKFAQLERFAELGRISSGLIHDLVSPLNLVSLNLEHLNRLGKSGQEQHLEDNKKSLTRAMIGLKRLENFVDAARRQVQSQEIKENFSVGQELRKVIQVISYTAKEKNITIESSVKHKITTYGNPSKFNQVVSNLLLNAIDAYESTHSASSSKIISIQVTSQDKRIAITVQDYGIGISQTDLHMIFRPFFTTKTVKKGMGLGLYISKEIVEKDFNGTLDVTSSKDQGTTFIFSFPLVTKKK